MLGIGSGGSPPAFDPPTAGDQKSVAAHKPRSRGILHSLFCCVCRDDGEPVSVHSGAPLLVEENGAVPKVCGGLEVRLWGAGAFQDLPEGHNSSLAPLPPGLTH